MKSESKALPNYYTITKSQTPCISIDIVPNPNYQLIHDDILIEISSDDPQFATVDKDNGVEEELMGVRMCGTYTDYNNITIAKYNNSGRSIEGNAIGIDRYDGAIHSNTDKK